MDVSDLVAQVLALDDVDLQRLESRCRALERQVRCRETDCAGLPGTGASEGEAWFSQRLAKLAREAEWVQSETTKAVRVHLRAIERLRADERVRLDKISVSVERMRQNRSEGLEGLARTRQLAIAWRRVLDLARKIRRVDEQRESAERDLRRTVARPR
jgi:hypothetical protein